ncbi:tannase and feruloyl esterase [Penicillium angulare]|uniref:tannase and feruloyl esterase n=1 Tax=Penicillium angulare TaxID=116970 RepID=UPI00254066D8|nr:tannase and feruloyl esterase [Penicillium angulare]KAJ5263642.1 tannase and feruloyl esterase [Penicillium angulare]
MEWQAANNCRWGGINWVDMGTGTHYGFATLSSNLGHVGVDTAGTWAIGRPQAVIDWGYRAWHGVTVLGKLFIKEWYGSAAEYSYFYGCSTGGRQSMKNMQGYPDDYDGILASAPAWWTTHQQLYNLKQTTYQAPANSFHTIPERMFDILATEVLRQCDPQDARKGSEAAWLLGNIGLGEDSTIDQQLWYPRDLMGLGDSFNWEDLDFSTMELADKLNPGNATADKYDISASQKRGGKFLHYHGLSDAYVSPDASIYYYDQASRALEPQGIEMDDFYRMFLIPGMEHCISTPDNTNAPWYIAGANQAATINTGTYSVPGYRDAKHDIIIAMMSWVENGTAPDSIIVVTKWKNDTTATDVLRQRPICHYPYQAKYHGKGDPDEASNWSCKLLY